MIWRIYKYTNTITGQSYIGQTTMNVNERAKKGKCYHRGTPFREAIDKYGFDTFEQSILRLCTSQEEADQYEQIFIDKYNTIYPNGYNLESGGKSGCKINNITKTRMSQNHANFNGHLNPNYGKKHTGLNSGENNPAYGLHWFNNGVNNIRAKECPEGYSLGKLIVARCN